jgi:hypothetical protein
VSEKTYITSQVDEDSELYQRFEDFVEDKGHSNQSAAVRDLVRTALDVHEGNRGSRWETVAQQSLYAVTFSLLAAVISLVSSLAAVVLASYPSPWTVVSLSFLFGSLLAATGSGLLHEYGKSKLDKQAADSEVNA